MSRIHSVVVAAASALAVATPAVAQTTGWVDYTFNGTVAITRADETVVRNPDGSTVTFASEDIPAYRYSAGDRLSTTFRVDLNSATLSNPDCGGRFTLTTTGGACTVYAQVSTPFGNLSYGGATSDSPPLITGIDLVADPATGGWRLDLPTGTYSMRWVGVNPYYYDSATGTLSGPTGNICVDVFNCPTGVITGTATSMVFGSIPIAGDFGKVRPGYNVGYLAGSAGTFALTGGFAGSTGGGGGDPTPVPEPGLVGLFALGAAGLVWRRRRARTA